jgi:hypothetical protein
MKIVVEYHQIPNNQMVDDEMESDSDDDQTHRYIRTIGRIILTWLALGVIVFLLISCLATKFGVALGVFAMAWLLLFLLYT